MAMGGMMGSWGGGKSKGSGGGGGGWGQPSMGGGMDRRRAAMADVLDRGDFGPPQEMRGQPPAGLEPPEGMMPQGMGQRPQSMPQRPEMPAAMMPPQDGAQRMPRRPNTMGMGLRGPSVPTGAVSAAMGSYMGRR